MKTTGIYRVREVGFNLAITVPKDYQKMHNLKVGMAIRLSWTPDNPALTVTPLKEESTS